jgi:haloalkane dehalogenase
MCYHRSDGCTTTGNSKLAPARIRSRAAGLFDALFRQDELIDSGALGRLEVSVSIIFGAADRYLNSTLAAEITGLFREPSLHLVHNASHWPQWDQPETVAELIRKATDNG